MVVHLIFYTIFFLVLCKYRVNKHLNICNLSIIIDIFVNLSNTISDIILKFFVFLLILLQKQNLSLYE